MKTSPLTRLQREALTLLRRAREDDPSTDDGLVTGAATFYDSEIAVAFVNGKTADALARRGLIRYGDWDADWGTEVVLVDG